jgi:CheY-like chemotaxis protein
MTVGAKQRGVVFVAEDEEVLRESTEQLLERAGFIVLSARNGKEALERMRGISGPSVAVINLMMPQMNGWELISAMRSTEALKHIPVIVVSGMPPKPLQGADRVLLKPFDPKQLVSAVRELCC